MFDEDVSSENVVFIASLKRVIACLGVPDEDVLSEHVDGWCSTVQMNMSRTKTSF